MNTKQEASEVEQTVSFNEFKIQELRQMCEESGLETEGNKQALVKRLIDAKVEIATEVDEVEQEDDEVDIPDHGYPLGSEEEAKKVLKRHQKIIDILVRGGRAEGYTLVKRDKCQANPNVAPIVDVGQLDPRDKTIYTLCEEVDY